MRLEEYVAKQFIEQYSHQVKAIFVEQLEELEYEFKDKVFTYLGFDPKSCKRISLESKLISSALKEAEGFKRHRDRGDDFSYLAESVWKEANGDKKIAYEEYLNQFLDDVREEFEYEVDFDEQIYDNAAWEEYLENYDYDKTDCQDLIRSKLGLSESDWFKVLGDGGAETIFDNALSSDQSYCKNSLIDELLNGLGLFYYDPDEEYAYTQYGKDHYQGPIKKNFENLEEYFFRKYINSEFINEIGLYVEDVKYVFNASVYTPQTTLLKVQQLKDVLVELKDKVSKITIEPSLIDNPEVTFASTVKDADLKAMKEAKALGLHTALVDAEFENLDIRSEFAPYIDTVYFGNDGLGSVQGSIRFPKFNGEFVLLSNENLKWYLGAMYLEEQGGFAYFRNRVYVGHAANLYITDFEAGSKATFTIGLYEGEGTFDFRLNALTSVKLGFTPIGKVNQYGSLVKNEVVYSVDTSSKVDIDLESFFKNCSLKIKPIFVGLYIEEIKKLIFSNESSIFLKLHQDISEPKVMGFFPSQFDPNQTTVLVVPKYKSPLYWRLFTNSRRDVKFDILYSPLAPESFGKSHLVFEHIKGNKTNQYVLNMMPHVSRTDQRGKHFENRAVFYDSNIDFEGSVFYKCFFVNSDAPTGTVAFKPIHSNYDLVLQEATSDI